MAEQEAPATLFRVGEDMTIYHAVAQKAALLVALATAPGLELDLAGVGEIDTAGLQLLMLVKREGERLGKPVRISAHSSAVQQAVEFCRLAASFGDPLLIPAAPDAGSAPWTN